MSADKLVGIADRIREIGARTSPEIFAEMLSAYAEVQRPTPADVHVERHVAYGPHERHRLNVFTPQSGPARGVLVFVHGGAFITGDKEQTSAFYDNVGFWAASQDLVGVTLNYRLAPQFSWPSGSDDVSAAIDWLRANIARFNGDPKRMFLFGHSAGATHVAGAVGRNSGLGLAGCICASGLYDLALAPVSTAYFGEDASLYPARSPLGGLAQTDTPLLVLTAELDPEPIQRHTTSLLAARLDARHTLPALAQIRDHNHFSVILHMNSPDFAIADEISRFIQRT
jgi:triacylglycerol lipase